LSLMAARKRRPRCIVIAGPNGAGKTTFARQYLPGIARVVHFVNADLIAGGLSPLKPELAAIAAARMVLREIDRLATERLDFAFETTLSGRTYVRRLELWKRAGYRIGAWVQSISRCAGSTPVSVREGTKYPNEMSYGASNAAGRTSKRPTNPWRKAGRCTTIQGRRRSY